MLYFFGGFTSTLVILFALDSSRETARTAR
jgi:hypothetical protein